MKQPIQKWAPKEAAHHAACARQCFRHDYDHGPVPDPLNCGGCNIRGLGTQDGKPNYAGWARCYVEAQMPIPRLWQGIFKAQLKSDNKPYALALARSLATFGHPGWKD